jgi:hypothetical protein
MARTDHREDSRGDGCGPLGRISSAWAWRLVVLVCLLVWGGIAAVLI